MRASLFLLSLTLIGCPGPAPSDAGTDVPTADVPAADVPENDAGSDAPATAGDLMADFCAPLAAQICDGAADCGCGALVPGGTLDRDACVARWTTRCTDAWQPFVTAGATVDAAAAAACVDALAAGTPACAAPSGTVVFAVCAPFVVQPVAIGAACTAPYCAGGDGVCVGGTCQMRGASGATCEDMFSCATGLVCDGGTCAALGAAGATCTGDVTCTPPLRCLGGTCGTLRAAGETCSATSECAIGLRCEGTCVAPGASCSGSDSCGNGSACGGLRSCTARLGAGETCAEDRDCEASLYCDGTCIARPSDGETCARGTVCAAGLGCDTDGGTCRPLPTDGAACAFGEMGPICATGFACVDGSTCGPLPTEGQMCAGVECAAGLGCDFTPEGSFCIVPRTEGGSCESDRSCAAAFHCGPSGTCEVDLAAGAPCSVGNECAGICAPDASGGLACRDAPARGDTCLFSDECPLADTCRATSPACFPEICGAL